ncbi:MAG: peptidylprolyl isomerase, partial [Wenzhouxiangellaceae bacterium]
MNSACVRRSRRLLIAAALVAACAALLQACGETSPGAEPVAVWDGGKIEREDYLAWLARQNLEPSRESVRALALIMSLAEAARQRGLDDSAEVDLAVEAMRQASLLPALKRHIDAQVLIPEEQIDQLVATYPDAFQQPRKLFLRGIYKRLPSGEPERAAVRNRMQELRAQTVDGADIKQLAARESESQSRYRDGSIGFVDPDRLPAPVGEAVEHLAIGDVSELIEHAGGLAFYVCERIRPKVVPDAEQVRFKFRQNLFRKRSAALNNALLEKLAPRIRIRLDQDPVLQAGGHELPADWLDDLVDQRLPGRDPASLTDRQKRRLLQEWGRRV